MYGRRKAEGMGREEGGVDVVTVMESGHGKEVQSFGPGRYLENFISFEELVTGDFPRMGVGDEGGEGL